MIYPFDCITDLIFAETKLNKSDIILVPGSDSPELMEKASELYHADFAPLILPSGRYNSKLPGYNSEWDFLRQIGISHHVPNNAILKENMAANTFENAIFSLKVINENNINLKHAIIVCKAYHSRRALLTYQTIFPKDITFYVSTVVDNTEIQKDNWFRSQDKINIVMGEVMKIGEYFKTEIHKLI